MRRDANDAEWKKVKETVFGRDGMHCRGIASFSAAEYAYFSSHSPGNIFTFDPAHIFPVSEYMQYMYCPDNIMVLCRAVHSRIDGLRSPVTGNPITRAQMYWFWYRFYKGIYIPYDAGTDYESEMKKIVLKKD